MSKDETPEVDPDVVDPDEEETITFQMFLTDMLAQGFENGFPVLTQIDWGDKDDPDEMLNAVRHLGDATSKQTEQLKALNKILGRALTFYEKTVGKG